jgi:hypothetical protein
MFIARSTLVAVTLMSVVQAALAQTDQTNLSSASSAGSTTASALEANPPRSDIAPSTWARVPRQMVHDPFAIATFGVEVSAFAPLAYRWPFPSSTGGFQRLAAPRLGQQDLYIGALHFFGHADIFVSFPLGSFSATAFDDRSLSLAYSVAAGAKLYPSALRPRTLRPYVSTGLMQRTFEITDGSHVDANVGHLSQAVVPLGAGVAWRTSSGLVADAQVQYVPGSATARNGIVARPLDEPKEPQVSERIDLSGFRFVAGVKWGRDLGATSAAGYREAKARTLQRRIDDGSISGVNVAIGPSTRLFNNSSTYFSDRRPYLREQYDTGLFPHVSLGYYMFKKDAEIRLAYRRIDAHATAFGAHLETRQSGLFLEALKFFDLDFYGFVPFAGAGLGYGELRATDNASGSSVSGRDPAWMLSIPFGWDIRPNPASAWVLRTNLRWVPRARVDFPRSRVELDMGGLEFDFIQFVLFPERLLKR